MKKLLCLIICSIVVVLLFSGSVVKATNYYTFTNGAPENRSLWWANTNGTGAHPANFENAADVFYIQNSNTMTQAAIWTVAGSLVINSSCALITTHTITITGTTDIYGSITMSGANSNTFTGNVTLYSTASWTNSTSSEQTFTGNFTNNASTFSSTGSGKYTFNGGGGKTINGGTATVVPSITFTSNYTNSGTITCETLLTVTGVAIRLTNNGTITATSALSGTGGLTQGATGVLNIGGTSAISTLTATAAGNTVNYNGTVAQTVIGTPYYNLSFSNSGAKTTPTTVTVGGNWDVGAPATLSTNSTNITVAGNVTGTGNITSGTGNITLGGNWTNSGTFTKGTGTVTYNGASPQTVRALNYNNLTLSGAGAKNAAYGTVAVGATLTNGSVLDMAENTLTLGTSTTNTGTIKFSGLNNGKAISTGIVEYSATGGGQTIATGSYNTLTLKNSGGSNNTAGGALTAATLNITAGGTLDMGTNQLLGLGTGLANAGTILTQNTGTALPTGKTWSGTVNYNAASAQTVSAGTYFNLTISNGGIKTISGVTVGGTYTLEGTATADAAPTYSGTTPILQYKGSSIQTTGAEFPTSFAGWVVIDNESGVVLSGTKTIDGNLIINNGKKFEIGSTSALTVSGTVDNSGEFTIKSTNSGTGSFINGTAGVGATVEKYLFKENVWGWGLCAPVETAPRSVFGTAPLTYYYDASATSPWTLFSSGNMGTMRGYMTRFLNDTTMKFTGSVLNTGEKKFESFYRTGNGSGNFGWNYIGNPYPSAIDWDLVAGLAVNGSGYAGFEAATKLYSPIYISDNNGGILVYNNYAGDFDGHIPAFKAFWIQVSRDYINATLPIAGAKLTLDNTVRVHSSNSKTTPSNVIKIGLDNGSYVNQTFFRLASDATPQFDPQYDAYKMFAQNLALPQLYSIANSEQYAINCISDDLTQAVAIPMGFVKGATNTLSIVASDLSTLDANITVNLEDKETNSMINLRTTPSYNFTATGSENNTRFVLHLGFSATSINENNTSKNNPTVYAYDNSIFVNFAGEKGIITVYNILGQEVAKSGAINGLNKINMNNLPSGNYIVNIINKNNSITEKVYIN